ncbi:hypothetical protein KSP39_PZI006783 [Platanthera zijinensis]|uniref:Uncharacterized protein n=1 Tax=Platanthera zijinensis TaxID=2320716 RepID=A0AAP0BPI8_9ASPA
MKSVALKLAADAGTTEEITIPIRGGAGVNLGAIGWALGLEPSTVRLNGYFLSRGTDFVSSLPWNSLLSFFAARGLPDGESPLDSILVQGKAVGQAG